MIHPRNILKQSEDWPKKVSAQTCPASALPFCVIKRMKRLKPPTLLTEPAGLAVDLQA
jgi:hypothetical protein